MRAIVELDKVANDVCIALGDTNFNQKLTVANHLIDCYRDFSLYVGSEFHVKTECFDFGNVIHLPNDFIYETKVGILNNGRVAILQLDKDRYSERLTDSECRDYMTNIWDGQYYDERIYFYNTPSGFGELYGLGRGVKNSSTYNINRADGVIELGSNIPHGSKFVLEYVSDRVSDFGLKVIPTEAKKMHEYYALTEMYMGFKFSNITKAQISRNQYEIEYKKVKRLYNYQDPQQIIDNINASFSPTNY